MASLFEGTPQNATSYVESTSEYPKWMQDAIYNQIVQAQSLASKPYTPYELPQVAELSPLQQQAYSQVQANQGAWKPDMDFASSGMKGFSTAGTADQLRSEQGQYLRQGLVDQNLNAGQNYWGQAGQMDVYGAAQPYMSQAGSTTAEALSDRALNAASPYLQSAAQTSAQNVGQYMNPYQQNVMDVVAQQGTRNLTENLLPGVSDAFIKAGQFGSSQMGEFGSRAVRDTQEAILNQQAQLANQGYGQALSASQADLSRQAQLAGTVGSISGADLSRVLQGGAQYGSLAETQGQLTGQQMQNLANLGQMQTTAGQAQQQYGISAAQAAQQAQAQDYARQMQALMDTATLAQHTQQMGYADTAALDAAGTSQRSVAQQQLDAAKAQYEAEQAYPWQQLSYAGEQIRGLASTVPHSTATSTAKSGEIYSPSVLSQLAGAGSLAKALTS